MRKLSLLFAILFIGMVSTAQAHTIAADAKTTQGAANVTLPVYNNSGVALDEGDVVVWDIVNSTGVDDLYVTTTTTADTGLVAGVVTSGGIAIATAGSIITYGFAQCDVGLIGGDAGTLLCTDTVAGNGNRCAAVVDEAQAYALTSERAVSQQVKCFIIR